MRKKMSSGIAALLLSFGIFAVVPAAPAAALSNCNLAQWHKFAQVKCTSGSGQVRAAIGCKKWWSGGYVWTRYGPWVGRGSSSLAQCRLSETPKVSHGRVWHWYESR